MKSAILTLALTTAAALCGRGQVALHFAAPPSVAVGDSVSVKIEAQPSSLPLEALIFKVEIDTAAWELLGWKNRLADLPDTVLTATSLTVFWLNAISLTSGGPVLELSLRPKKCTAGTGPTAWMVDSLSYAGVADPGGTLHDVGIGLPPLFLAVTTSGLADLGPDTVRCSAAPVLLTATTCSACSVKWDDSSTASTRTVLAAGAYAVTVTSPGGCTDADSILVKDAATVGLPPLGTRSLCADSLVKADAGCPGCTCTWADGSHDAVRFFSKVGVFTVKTTSAGGCAVFDTLRVVAAAVDSVPALADTAACGGRPISIDLTKQGFSFHWSDGSTSSLRQLTADDSLWVKITGPDGCVRTDSFSIKNLPAPVFSMPADTVVCHPPLLLGSPCAGCQWLDGATKKDVFEIDSTGLFILTAVNVAGCATADTMRAKASKLALSLGGGQVICPGDSVKLVADCTGCAVIEWQPASSKGPEILVDRPGKFTAAAVDSLGCAAAAAVEVFEQRPGPSGGCGLWLPDFLSPNGDARNDLLDLGDLPGRVPSWLTVFDRWGQLAFQTSAYKNDWAGRDQRGKRLPDGVYFYTVTLLLAGEERHYSSSLLIAN